jgi:hypothetical protein
MSRSVDSRTIDVGSQLNVDERHRVIVVDNQPDGLYVMWYTPEGMGPFYATLPHCQLVQHHYIDERAGRGQHYMEFHPDFTGKPADNLVEV